MIASGTPLDFTMGFYKRQTTAVLLFFWFIKPPVLIRQWGPPSIPPTLHFPLSISLYRILSISFFNLHNSVIHISFILLLIPFHSLHVFSLTHPYFFSSLSPSNPHILVAFFLFSIFSFLPPSWLHRATSCLRICRKHIKGCTLANPAEQPVSKLLPPKHATHMCVCHSCTGSHEAWQEWKTLHSLRTAHQLSLTHRTSYTHISSAQCQQTLQTTTQASDVCVPTSPSRVFDTALLTFWGCGGSEGQRGIWCFT